MNWESIITGVLTGVIASAITGSLGVLFAFKQLKKQRAFDRQLEWYERTARALGTFSQLHSAEATAQTFNSPDRETKALELRQGLLNLDQCVNEAVLYAEQSSYEHLQEMGKKCFEIKSDTESAVIDQIEVVHEIIRATVVGLSSPVRKMLGLKEIVPRK